MDRPPGRKHAKAPESVAAQRFPALIVSSHAGGHWFESSSLHHEKTLETLVLRAFRSLPVCLSLFTCARSVRCHMGQCALLRWSGGGHHAAELSCGRLRRCPVIRPATDLRIYDTPYDRRRTLTAAYRAGACLSLDGCRAVPSQRFKIIFFLFCAEAISARFSFPAVSRRWQVPRKNSKQKRRKNLPAVSASYDPSCVCSIVQF